MNIKALGASLFVTSIPSSVTFYRDMLGFTFEGYWDGEKHVQDWTHPTQQPSFASFKLGESALGLFINEGTKIVGDAGVFHVKIPDAQTYYQELKTRGLFVKPPLDAPCGTCILTLDDPDGHLWNFYSA